MAIPVASLKTMNAPPGTTSQLSHVITKKHPKCTDENTKTRSSRTSNRVRNSRKRKHLQAEELHQKRQKIRSNIWRAINQHHEPCELRHSGDLMDYENEIPQLVRDYDDDVKTFRTYTRNQTSYYDCAVCGISDFEDARKMRLDDVLFSPLANSKEPKKLNHESKLQETNSSNIAKCLREHWIGYNTKHETHVSVCPVCYQSLQRKKKPYLSRKKIPLYMPEHKAIYFGLTEFEKLLISPVLPIIYVYRFNGYGHYQSKGKCIAFRNDFQKIASTLPRKRSDIILNISEVYRKGNVQVRPKLIRKAI